jgi:hypothetical protein
MLSGLSACASLSSERLIYNQGGARIGIEPDPSVSRARAPVRNQHPATFTAEEIRSLIRVIQVSGWSGAFKGVFESPRLVPLLTEEELHDLAVPLANALQQAGPTERVFFSFPKQGVAYSEDRTAGALFARGQYLHIVVTDHASVIWADTGGGEARDLRDTKGMKLWVAKPAQEATVPDAVEPSWAPFETVHISLNAKEVLAIRSPAQPVYARPAPATTPKVPQPLRDSRPTQEDLQLQIRELTRSNLELRGRLDDQMKQMKEMTEEMNRLRLELDKTKPTKQSPRKAPSP